MCTHLIQACVYLHVRVHIHGAFCASQNNPTSPLNLPEHDPWADNGATKALGNEFNGTTLRYKRHQEA